MSIKPRYVSFSPDSSLLAIGYGYKGVELLSVPKFSRIAYLDFSDSQAEEPPTIFQSSWSSDGFLIAASSGDGRIRVWRTADWSELVTKQLHDCWDEAKYVVAFSPDGKLLASGRLGKPKFLSTTDWRVLIAIGEDPTEDCLAIAWNPDSTLLAIAGRLGSPFEVWRIFY